MANHPVSRGAAQKRQARRLIALATDLDGYCRRHLSAGQAECVLAPQREVAAQIRRAQSNPALLSMRLD